MDIKSQIRSGLPTVGVNPYRQIHLHSTGNPSSTAQNEADYMNRKDINSGFFTHVVGNGQVIQTAPVSCGAYDVGGAWNYEAYAALELIESHKTQAEFERDYRLWVDLARKLADEAKIPKTLDSGTLEGIKTHNYCTYNQPNNASDHIDPYPYLTKWGVSKEKLANDLSKGFGGSNSKVKPQAKPQSTSNNTGQKVNQGIYRADDFKKVNGIWQVRCNFLVPTDFDWTDNGISVDDIVLVDSNGYILKDQATKTGSLFVFNTNYIKTVGSAQSGSGSYNWCQVNLSHSGNIWLSVMDKNDLIHKVSNA